MKTKSLSLVKFLAVTLALAAAGISSSMAAPTTISYANLALVQETAVSSTAGSSTITLASTTGYAVGDLIRFTGTTTGTNPFSTTATNYYIVSISGSTITVATTPGGTALNAANNTSTSTTTLAQGLLTGSNWTGGTAPNSNSALANFGNTVSGAPAYVINGGNQTVYGVTFNGGGSSDLSLISGGNGTGYNRLIFATNDLSTPKVTLNGGTRLIAFGSTVVGQKLAVGGSQGLIFNSLAGGALSGSGLAATSTAPAKEIRLQNVDWTNFSGGIAVERGELRINDAKGVLPNQTLTVGNAQTTTNNTLAVLNLSTFGSTVDGLNGTSLGRIYGASTLTVGNADGSGDFGGVIGQSWTGTTTVTNLIKTGTGTQTISGAIVGGGAVTVSNGTLLLSGSNSYTGVTTATGSGILKVGSLTALSTSVLGATTGTFTGTLDVNGFAITNAFADKSIQGGTITNTGAAVDLTGMGAIGATAARNLNAAGTGNITFGQAFTGSYTLSKTGTNTVTLSGSTANSLAIGTISQGVLELAKSSGNAINGSTATINGGTLRLNGSGTDQINNSTALVVTSGTFDMNGKSETAGTLTVGDGTTNGTVSGGSSSTYTLNSSGNSFDLRSGSVDVILAGAGALSKSTSGSVTLSQANTYTGTTTVTAGTLVVNGSTAAGSAFTVDVTGTLAGSGTVNGSVALTGTLSPGNSPGLISTGAQTWNNTGNYNWQILNATGAAGTGYDSTAITGSLDLSNLTAGGFSINLWSLSSTGPDVNGNALNFVNTNNYSWVLASTTTGVTGFDAASFTINTAANNGTAGFSNLLNGSFSVGVTGNDLMLNYTAVPEPATWALIAFSLTTVIVFRRRRTT